MAKIVIGHRMGKGDLVKQGLEAEGHEVIVIPGMLADMKLGDVMNEQKADYGISFCGSGGAGATTAENKYGYKAKSHLWTVKDGTGAIEEGYKVLGFGFMDTVELGKELGRAINAKK